jgi:hypothetical protein
MVRSLRKRLETRKAGQAGNGEVKKTEAKEE